MVIPDPIVNAAPAGWLTLPMAKDPPPITKSTCPVPSNLWVPSKSRVPPST